MKRLLALGLLFIPLALSARVALVPYGGGYIGKYFPRSDRYNADASIALTFDVVEFGARNAWYVYYANDLEMARQAALVFFDPYYSHWDITTGAKFFWREYCIRGYYVHDCVHSIDRPLDSNKVVFNRFKLAAGSQLAEPRTYSELNRGNRPARLRFLVHPLWQLTYGYYPVSTKISWVNSYPYYHHDLTVSAAVDIFEAGPWELDLRSYTHLAARVTPDSVTGRTRHATYKLTLAAAYYTGRAWSELFLDYYPYTDDPLKAPNHMVMLGVRLGF